MTCSRWRSVKSTSVRNIDDLSIPSVASSRSARLNVPSKRSVASSTSIRTAVGRMPWRSSTSSQCFVSIGSALRSRRPETVRCAGSNFTIGGISGNGEPVSRERPEACPARPSRRRSSAGRRGPESDGRQSRVRHEGRPTLGRNGPQRLHIRRLRTRCQGGRQVRHDAAHALPGVVRRGEIKFDIGRMEVVAAHAAEHAVGDRFRPGDRAAVVAEVRGADRRRQAPRTKAMPQPSPAVISR